MNQNWVTIGALVLLAALVVSALVIDSREDSAVDPDGESMHIRYEGRFSDVDQRYYFRLNQSDVDREFPIIVEWLAQARAEGAFRVPYEMRESALQFIEGQDAMWGGTFRQFEFQGNAYSFSRSAS